MIDKIDKYVRVVNYLSVTQIYLKDNFLLKEKLQDKDIKPKLFGHWGTCPGINFVYAHLNYFIKNTKQSTMFVLGPGHGFPALQANLFLEGTLQKFYPQATLNEKGIGYISKAFSWPYGVSSHSNPQAPGLILEGGELGYSLATSYGAILDNPELLVACMIGDGEAETGAISAAWHINKLINPAANGAVLPILHVNGFKISGPTIYGRMSDKELYSLFKGYGYEAVFVKAGENVHEDMQKTLMRILGKIKNLQEKSRKEKIISPEFPMIILQTPKGWTGIKELKGKKIEGDIGAHQVVAPNARKDEEELGAIEDWLKSYKFNELFIKGKFDEDILSILPEEKLRMGQNIHAYSGKIYKKLNLPREEELEEKVEEPGKIGSQSMRKAGVYLQKVFELNKKEKNFRLFSPDETYSNRLDDVFKATSRAFMWPTMPNDKDMDINGRVMEMLSEHNLHGLIQGYILTGRHGVLTTYEAFAEIFSSMAHQYEKFLKVARVLSWRGRCASMNYLISSVLWRQEHNGFTHQNPAFMTGMLEKHDCKICVYFPVDDNSMCATLKECLLSENGINIIVAGKTVEPRYLKLSEAQKNLEERIATWDFASDKDPDIVLVGIGDYMTKEVVAALEMVKIVSPEIKIRFVNIQKLSGKCECSGKHQQIPNASLHFTKDKPVIINFNGYPETIESMLVGFDNPNRFSVHGYLEEGGTTTPFDMQVRNKTDRYHLSLEIIETMMQKGVIKKEKAEKLINHYKETLLQHYEYITAYGTDPIELEEWHLDSKDKRIDNGLQLKVLEKSKTIAIVGLSKNPDQYSNKVGIYLSSKGFNVIPVNPNYNEVLDKKSYAKLKDIPKSIPIDIAAIYRRSEDVFPHIKDALERDIKTIWLPEGVRNPQAEKYAKEHGAYIISDFCIMKEHQKLTAKLSALRA